MTGEPAPEPPVDAGLDSHGDEILQPGQLGARHVEQAFAVSPVKAVLEQAQAQGRTVMAFLLRRWIKQMERDFYAREARIQQHQAKESASKGAS